VVWSNPYTKVSETAKTCTDEQKPDMRLYRLDEVAQHTEVQMCLSRYSRSGRDRSKGIRLTEGDPTSDQSEKEVSRGHSNQQKRAVTGRIKAEASHTDEGPNMT
jgi:hypothetical protein